MNTVNENAKALHAIQYHSEQKHIDKRKLADAIGQMSTNSYMSQQKGGAQK